MVVSSRPRSASGDVRRRTGRRSNILNYAHRIADGTKKGPAPAGAGPDTGIRVPDYRAESVATTDAAMSALAEPARLDAMAASAAA